MEAYGFSTKMSEADCVAELMKMYQKLTEEKLEKLMINRKRHYPQMVSAFVLTTIKKLYLFSVKFF